MDDAFSLAPDLTDAIDRNPLVLPPQTLLSDAIAQISRVHDSHCSLTGASSQLENEKPQSSCTLVVEKGEVLGIVTERDVVRLTAEAVNFKQTTVADVMIHPVVTLPEQSIKDVFAALFLFRRYRIRHLPITDEQGQLFGVITHESIRKIMRPANLLQFRRVSDVMTPDVIHAPLQTSVFRLAWLMSEHRVSCIVITTEDDERLKPVGIVTERDMVQFQSLNINLMKTQAQDVMSSPLFLLSPDDSLWSAHQEMQARRVGRLVVSWNWGKGLGIVTQTSLLRVFDPLEMYGVIENLQQTIAQLKQERQTILQDPGVFSENSPSNSNQESIQSDIGVKQNSNGDTFVNDIVEDMPHLSRDKVNLMLDYIRRPLDFLSGCENLSLDDFRKNLTLAQQALDRISQEIDQ